MTTTITKKFHIDLKPAKGSADALAFAREVQENSRQMHDTVTRESAKFPGLVLERRGQMFRFEGKAANGKRFVRSYFVRFNAAIIINSSSLFDTWPDALDDYIASIMAAYAPGLTTQEAA